MSAVLICLGAFLLGFAAGIKLEERRQLRAEIRSFFEAWDEGCPICIGGTGAACTSHFL